MQKRAVVMHSMMIRDEKNLDNCKITCSKNRPWNCDFYEVQGSRGERRMCNKEEGNERGRSLPRRLLQRRVAMY